MTGCLPYAAFRRQVLGQTLLGGARCEADRECRISLCALWSFPAELPGFGRELLCTGWFYSLTQVSYFLSVSVSQLKSFFLSFSVLFV